VRCTHPWTDPAKAGPWQNRAGNQSRILFPLLAAAPNPKGADWCPSRAPGVLIPPKLRIEFRHCNPHQAHRIWRWFLVLRSEGQVSCLESFKNARRVQDAYSSLHSNPQTPDGSSGPLKGCFAASFVPVPIRREDHFVTATCVFCFFAHQLFAEDGMIIPRHVPFWFAQFSA